MFSLLYPSTRWEENHPPKSTVKAIKLLCGCRAKTATQSPEHGLKLMHTEKPGEKIYCPALLDARRVTLLSLGPKHVLLLPTPSVSLKVTWTLALCITVLYSGTSRAGGTQPRASTARTMMFPRYSWTWTCFSKSSSHQQSEALSWSFEARIAMEILNVPSEFSNTIVIYLKEGEVTTHDAVTAPEPHTCHWWVSDDLYSTSWFGYTLASSVSAFLWLENHHGFNDLPVLIPVSYLTWISSLFCR